MFEIAPLVYLGRLPDGRVRLLRLKHPPAIWPRAEAVIPSDAVNIDVLVTAEQWAAGVASVSAMSENARQYFRALSLHNDRFPVDTTTGERAG